MSLICIHRRDSEEFSVVLFDCLFQCSLTVVCYTSQECHEQTYCHGSQWSAYDIRQSAPRGRPLIGAERRGLPPREESLVAWGAAAV